MQMADGQATSESKGDEQMSSGFVSVTGVRPRLRVAGAHEQQTAGAGRGHAPTWLAQTCRVTPATQSAEPSMCCPSNPLSRARSRRTPLTDDREGR